MSMRRKQKNRLKFLLTRCTRELITDRFKFGEKKLKNHIVDYLIEEMASPIKSKTNASHYKTFFHKILILVYP